MSDFLHSASRAVRSVLRFSLAVISRSLAASLLDRVGGKGITSAIFRSARSEGVNRSLQMQIIGRRTISPSPPFFFFSASFPVMADTR